MKAKYKITLPKELPALQPLDVFDKYSELPLWKMLSEYRVLVNGTPVIIPIGFRTDLTSVPRIFHAIYPPHNPRYTPAALPHDVLYAAQILPQQVCDDVFLSILIAKKNSFFAQFSLYQAVDKFGKASYDRNRKRMDRVKAVRRMMGLPVIDKCPLFSSLEVMAEYYSKQ